MIRPNFDHFKHSAKGSEWEDHKYIKRIDGTYYYPDSYEGGRHLSDLDTKKLADETIQGRYGNGQTRKDLLGENYQQVQDKVNEILKSPVGDQKIESDDKKKKTPTSNIVSGVDMSKVMKVYVK